MTARLLSPEKLTKLLERRCHGETVKNLAKFYNFTPNQIQSMLSYHRAEYQSLRAKLGLDPLTHRTLTPGTHKSIYPTQGINRQCNSCDRFFWTNSPYIRKCSRCKDGADYQSGQDFSSAYVGKGRRGGK